MKFLLIAGLAMSLAAHANTGAQSSSTGSAVGTGAGSQGTGYAPNNGTAQPGNPGTFTTPKAGLGQNAPATTTRGTDINGAGTMGSSAQATPSSGMNPSRTNDVSGVDQSTTLESTNSSPNPVPDSENDLTLQNGKTQTGPYKTPGNKQSQESSEEELDYRAIPSVDHDEQNASGTP